MAPVIPVIGALGMAAGAAGSIASLFSHPKASMPQVPGAQSAAQSVQDQDTTIGKPLTTAQMSNATLGNTLSSTNTKGNRLLGG